MTATTETRPIGSVERGGATMVEALNAALDAELAADDRVVLLGEDIGVTGGVFRVTAGLQERYGADRVLDTPISESGFTGMAVGMCLAGARPIVEMQFDAFTYPAFNQIVTHVARYRWRTAGTVDMPLVIRIPYGGGTHAPELHSDSPEAVFCHMPGLKVVSPSTPPEAYALLRWAVRHDDPVIFLEPKRVYRSGRAEVTGEETLPDQLPLRVARDGSDVTVVSYGSTLERCVQAAQMLADDGVQARVLDLRSLWPLDEDALLDHVRATGRCVVVHEAPRSMGVGAEVAALVAEHALLSLEAPVTRVAGLDVPFPLYVHEQEYLPSVDRIVAAVRRTVEF